MENEKIEMDVGHFINLMEDKEVSDKCSDELDELLDILFENTKLSYDSENLYFDINSSELTGYLKARERHRYIGRLKELQKEEKEKENAKIKDEEEEK